MRKQLSLFIVFLAVFPASLRADVGPPKIVWVNGPISKGEVVIFSGENLLGARLYLGSSPVPADDLQEVPVFDRTPSSFKAIIPFAFDPDRARYKIETQVGIALGFLNDATIYWILGDQGSSGTTRGWIRAVGKGLAGDYQLFLRKLGEADTVKMERSSANYSDATFSIPSTATPGVYEIIKSSVGGDSIKVAETFHIIEQSVKRSTVVDIEAFGPHRNNEKPSTIAFKNALRALKSSGGGVLRVSAGAFVIDEQLEIPEDTHIVGRGSNLTTLILKDLDSPPDIFLKGGKRFTIENISIVARRHAHIIVGGKEELVAPDEGVRIRIQGVRIATNMHYGGSAAELSVRETVALERYPPRGPEALILVGPNVQVLDSEVHASMSAFLFKNLQGALVRGNRFVNGRRGWYSITNSSQIVFEYNDVSGGDLGSSGGSINTLWGPGRQLSKNILIKRNRFHDFPDGDGEGITTDTPGGCYMGRLDMLTPLWFSLPSSSGRDLSACRAGGLVVVSGTGLGSASEIERLEGSKIQLKQALAMKVDGATEFAIVPLTHHVIVWGNRITDTGPAIQLFGTSWYIDIIDNIISRSNGIRIIGREYGGEEVLQPVYFVNVVGNSVSGGAQNRRAPHDFDPVAIEVRGIPIPKVPFAALQGAFISRNFVGEGGKIRMRGDNIGVTVPTVFDIVIQNNRGANDQVIEKFFGVQRVYHDHGFRRP